jgi:hypothetical protein
MNLNLFEMLVAFGVDFKSFGSIVESFPLCVFEVGKDLIAVFEGRDHFAFRVLTHVGYCAPLANSFIQDR